MPNIVVWRDATLEKDQGSAHMNGVSAIIKEVAENSVAPSSRRGMRSQHPEIRPHPFFLILESEPPELWAMIYKLLGLWYVFIVALIEH